MSKGRGGRLAAVVAGTIVLWASAPEGAAETSSGGPLRLAQRESAAGGTAMRCTTVTSERGRETGRVGGSETLRFDPPVLVRGRGEPVDFSAANGETRAGIERLADGSLRYWQASPRGIVELEVRDGTLVRYRETVGVLGSVNERVCEP